MTNARFAFLLDHYRLLILSPVPIEGRLFSWFTDDIFCKSDSLNVLHMKK